MMRTTFIIVLISYGLNVNAQNCQSPKNLFVSDLGTCSATLHWDKQSGVKKFSVAYKKTGTTKWSPWVSTGIDTVFKFTGLAAGIKYDFGVKSKCQDGSSSKSKKTSETTLTCILPDKVSIVSVDNSTVKIVIGTSCPYDSAFVKYQTLNGTETTITFPFSNSYPIDGLNADSTYLISVSTCNPYDNTWTTPDTFSISVLPNIILILVDDSRYDYYSCNGAFPFIQTPNIDRIANEGVNFKHTYVPTSLCAPSRASIATGLFTLKTGVLNNQTTLDTSFYTIPEVLRDHGYYTAMIGKNAGTFLQGNKPEFDYYLVSASGEVGISLTYFNYNGVFKSINVPNVLTVTDSAISVIKKTTEPLFLWLAYPQPHHPDFPLPEFIGKYDQYQIPWLPDTAKFNINYPSFIYQDKLIHGTELDTTFRNVMEVVAGLDSCIGEILETLEATGKLENTLLIFTSDNGFMMGSHWLDGKTLAYEPSMRTPLFVRYRDWFDAGSVVTNQFASNLDIASTIYDAAKINFNGPLDGVSLRSLYNNELSRTEFYYMMYEDSKTKFPSKRAIRDKYFKYVFYSCSSDTVEELFDMVNDTLELNNLINNSSFDSVLQAYRVKFDWMRHEWGDTISDPLKSCFIKNPTVLKEMMDEFELYPSEPVVFPTIARESVEIYLPWPPAIARLFDDYGKIIDTWEITDTYTQIHFRGLEDGLYYLNLSNSNGSATKKLIIVNE